MWEIWADVRIQDMVIFLIGEPLGIVPLLRLQCGARLGLCGPWLWGGLAVRILASSMAPTHSLGVQTAQQQCSVTQSNGSMFHSAASSVQ